MATELTEARRRRAAETFSADLRTPRRKVRDYEGNQNRALHRAADLAHRDPGHIGRLDMCEAELCRLLGEAGAE